MKNSGIPEDEFWKIWRRMFLLLIGISLFCIYLYFSPQDYIPSPGLQRLAAIVGNSSIQTPDRSTESMAPDSQAVTVAVEDEALKQLQRRRQQEAEELTRIQQSIERERTGLTRLTEKRQAEAARLVATRLATEQRAADLRSLDEKIAQTQNRINESTASDPSEVHSLFVEKESTQAITTSVDVPSGVPAGQSFQNDSATLSKYVNILAQLGTLSAQVQQEKADLVEELERLRAQHQAERQALEETLQAKLEEENLLTELKELEAQKTEQLSQTLSHIEQAESELYDLQEAERTLRESTNRAMLSTPSTPEPPSTANAEGRAIGTSSEGDRPLSNRAYVDLSGEATVMALPENPSETAMAVSPECQLKAAYVYQFLKLVRWPSAVLPHTSLPMVIGVVGDDPFGDALDQIASDRAVNGRRIKIQRLSPTSNLFTSHLLFIAQSEKQQLSRILADLKHAPIVTVSDIDGFVDQGGMFEFVEVGSTVRYKMNLKALEEGSLSTHSHIQRLAYGSR